VASAASATASSVATNRAVRSPRPPQAATAAGPATASLTLRVAIAASCRIALRAAASGSRPFRATYRAVSSSALVRVCARRVDASAHSSGSTPTISRAFPSGRSANTTPCSRTSSSSNARSYAAAADHPARSPRI
jgi:hypothetical protein